MNQAPISTPYQTYHIRTHERSAPNLCLWVEYESGKKHWEIAGIYGESKIDEIWRRTPCLIRLLLIAPVLFLAEKTIPWAYFCSNPPKTRPPQ